MMRIFGNLYQIVLDNIQVAPKTKDIAIRTTTFSFEPVSSPQYIEETSYPQQRGIDFFDGDYVSIDQVTYALPALSGSRKKYHSIQEVSMDTGIPEQTLYKWCRDDELTAIKDANGHWWIEGRLVRVKKFRGRWSYHQVLS